VYISFRGLDNSKAKVRLEGLSKLKKINDLIGTRTRDLPACSIEKYLPGCTRDIPEDSNFRCSDNAGNLKPVRNIT
jgi:hypothetical protein